MRIAYLDGFSGISGDMFLGALVDAGVPFDLFQETVAALDLGITLEASRVDRNGISATKVDVIVNGQKDLPREEFWALSIKDHASGHTHADDADHAHDHGHEDRAPHGHSHGRNLDEILKIIEAAPISRWAKQTASEIFVALGTAEAKVHNVDVEHVHFHEVGAADAIADIVCAAIGAEALAVDQFLSSPLNVGGGTVKCAHGVMPVPAPATMELLKGIPVYCGEVQKELVTPTGAAIVRVLAKSFGPRPMMTAEKIGYGAGARDFPRHSNVLRLTVGETVAAGTLTAHPNEADAQDEVVVLEANLDDLSPQIIGYLTDQLLAEGALDVFSTAVQMKKSRPGTLLTVLTKPQDESKLRELIFRESSTLGIRSRNESRHILARRHESVQTPWGEVRIKIGSMAGADSQLAPEYEDCRRIAAEHHVPLKTVMQEALRLYQDKKNG
jgi:uncharacterized protein (TIGR00299 family) protein